MMMKQSMAFLKVAAVLAITVGCGAVQAEKPSWAGGGKHDRDEARHEDRRDDRRDYRRDERRDYRFDADARRIAMDYYGERARAGHCPPGLAKKRNGCQPPGQAKKWSKGQPLPADVRYYDVPRELLVRLPPPPPQHRYVEVAGDILMIAAGTSMVVDALDDLMR